MQSYADVGVSTGDVMRIFAIAATCTGARSRAGSAASSRARAPASACARSHAAEYAAAFGEWRAGGDSRIDADCAEKSVEALATGGRLSRVSRRSARAAFVYEYVCRV